MAEIPDFIDPSLVADRPGVRQVEKILYTLDRRTPHPFKDVLYAGLYAFPGLRHKQITCESTTVTVQSRSKDEWYITGHPVDEGVNGRQLIGLFEKQEDNGTFLDVGASTGMYSVFALKRGLRVVAFEPDPQIFGILSANAALNQKNYLQPLFFQAALDKADGKAVLHSDGFKEACPSLAQTGNQKAEIPVITHSLDSLVVRNAIPLPTIAKIDVEGGEAGVLEGGAETFSSKTIRDLFVEIHPQFLPLFGSSADKVWRMILEFGYQPQLVVPKGDEFFCHFLKID